MMKEILFCLFDESNVVNSAISIHLCKCDVVYSNPTFSSLRSIIKCPYSEHDSIINTNDRISSGPGSGSESAREKQWDVRPEQCSASQHGVRVTRVGTLLWLWGSESELWWGRARARAHPGQRPQWPAWVWPASWGRSGWPWSPPISDTLWTPSRRSSVRV